MGRDQRGYGEGEIGHCVLKTFKSLLVPTHGERIKEDILGEEYVETFFPSS